MRLDNTSTDGTKDHRKDPQSLSRSPRGAVATLDLRSESSWQVRSPAAVTDPQVAAALEEYLDALNSDSPPAREEFLDRHPTIAGALAECLSGLEFIQATGWQLGGGEARWPSPAQDEETASATRPAGGLSDRPRAGPREHGGRLRGRASLARPPGCPQGPAARLGDRPAAAATVPDRGPGRRPAQPSPHRADLRGRLRPGGPFLRHAVCRRPSLAELLVESPPSGPAAAPRRRLSRDGRDPSVRARQAPGPMPGQIAPAGWASRRRRRSTMRTAWAWSTATSSRPISWSTPSRSSGSPTSAWRGSAATPA